MGGSERWDGAGGRVVAVAVAVAAGVGGLGERGLRVEERKLLLAREVEEEEEEGVRAKGKKGGEFGAAVRRGEGGCGWEGGRSMSSKVEGSGWVVGFVVVVEDMIRCGIFEYVGFFFWILVAETKRGCLMDGSVVMLENLAGDVVEEEVLGVGKLQGRQSDRQSVFVFHDND